MSIGRPPRGGSSPPCMGPDAPSPRARRRAAAAPPPMTRGWGLLAARVNSSKCVSYNLRLLPPDLRPREYPRGARLAAGAAPRPPARRCTAGPGQAGESWAAGVGCAWRPHSAHGTPALPPTPPPTPPPAPRPATPTRPGHVAHATHGPLPITTLATVLSAVKGGFIHHHHLPLITWGSPCRYCPS